MDTEGGDGSHRERHSASLNRSKQPFPHPCRTHSRTHERRKSSLGTHARASTLIMTAVFGVLLASASPAVAQEGAVFRTPGEAAYCNDYSGDLICWTPNDGFTVDMTKRGRPHKSYRKDHIGYVDNRAPVLRCGKTKRLSSFVCKSRSSGLTCTNLRGHGWRLGRYVGYRLF